MKTKNRFLCPGEIKYIKKKAWKNSTAARYQPEGGFFTELDSDTLDLTLLFGDLIRQFNENSQSVYSSSGYVTLDEILSKAKSRKNLIKQYNQGKKDKVGILFHLLTDSNSNFCIRVNLKMPKQFTDPRIYRTEGLCKFFLEDFHGSHVTLCQDNFFNSFGLCEAFNNLGIYCFGTIRRQMIQRYFDDHLTGISSFIQPKHSKTHSIRCFTHKYENATKNIHCMVYNVPAKNSVLFLSNSNNIFGKTTDNICKDYRLFFGGNFSREFNSTNFRPIVADKYNQKMGSCDNFDVYVHRFSLRFIPMKNKLSWILKPVFSILEFQFINSFMLYREAHSSPDMDFRLYLLKISQGLVKNNVIPEMAPLRVRANGSNFLFPRNFCQDCKSRRPSKDSRTSKKCAKCGSGCCRTHSETICRRCLD